MKKSKELMTVAGVLPKLRLGERTGGKVTSTGPHKVTLLEDKIIKKFDRESKGEIEYVRYTVEENGEKKYYDTRLKKKGTNELSYLVQRLGDVEEGTQVVLEMKKAGIQNYVEVSVVGGSSKVEADEHEDVEDEIPL